MEKLRGVELNRAGAVGKGTNVRWRLGCGQHTPPPIKRTEPTAVTCEGISSWLSLISAGTTERSRDDWTAPPGRIRQAVQGCAQLNRHSIGSEWWFDQAQDTENQSWPADLRPLGVWKGPNYRRCFQSDQYRPVIAASSSRGPCRRGITRPLPKTT